MAGKGFLDGLLDDMVLWGAVQASKDKNGKPDPYKAAGMAMGYGMDSTDDLLELQFFLRNEGAFQKDKPQSDPTSAPLPRSTPRPARTFDIAEEPEEPEETDDNIFGSDDLTGASVFDIADEPVESFADTWIGDNLVSAEDMQLLSEAGYDEWDLDAMEPDELRDVMEDAGVDTCFYDFDD